jgi:hypothetical protein
LPFEQSQQIERKFFDYAVRIASRFTRNSRSTTVSQASQPMISQWCLETAQAAGEKQIQEWRPTPD